MKNYEQKDRIVAEALDLFAARGYAAASIKMLAERIGVAGPSLYNHFRSKPQLMAHMLPRLDKTYDKYSVTEDELDISSASDLAELLRNHAGVLFGVRTIRNMRRFFSIEQGVNADIRDRYLAYRERCVTGFGRKIAEHLIKRGFAGNDLDAEIAGRIIMSPVMGYIRDADQGLLTEENMMQNISMHALLVWKNFFSRS